MADEKIRTVKEMSELMQQAGTNEEALLAGLLMMKAHPFPTWGDCERAIEVMCPGHLAERRRESMK